MGGEGEDSQPIFLLANFELKPLVFWVYQSLEVLDFYIFALQCV
jgi:hypothetical protein